MKKIFKTLAILGVAGVAAAGVASFTACNSDKSYNGDYHYTSPYGFDYGIKVKVEVNKDNVITKVSVVESDYVEATAAETWGEEEYNNWVNNLNGLLAKYEGKTVAEILAIEVPVVSADQANEYTPAGQPSVSADALEGLVISGATQGSGRLLLAVQDAIKDLAE